MLQPLDLLVKFVNFSLLQLSRITNVESQYIKYLTTTKTRYCEVYLVVDNGVVSSYVMLSYCQKHYDPLGLF